MLIATPNGERRLFRQGDEAHPARAGKITPEREDLPEAYRSLLDWYLTTYDTPSSNVEDNVTSLPDMEAAVQAQTERELFEAQTLLMRVLNTYIDGFSELGSYTAAHDRDPRILMLALITRSFNSSWCAYDLARRRHYQQSIALSRMVQEDWLTSFDVAFNEDTRSALWGKRRPRSFQAMAEAVSKVLPEDDKGQWWRDSYGPASEASHPRGLALAMQFERDAIRFGPIYARDLAFGSLATLIDAAARMLTVFNHVFSLDLDNNLKELKRDIRAWFTWLKEQRPAANELIEEEPA